MSKLNTASNEVGNGDENIDCDSPLTKLASASYKML